VHKVLAIDIGTTNVKAAIFDENGKTLSLARTEVPLHSPAPNSAVQKLDELYNATIKSVRNAVSQAKNAKVNVIAFSAQMHGLGAIDDKGREVLPLVTYLDTRPAVAIEKLEEIVNPRELYENTGCPPLFTYPLAKLVWLSLTRPNIMREARWFVSAKDYVIYKIFGEPYIDESVMSGSQLLDIQRLKWSDLALSSAGVDEGKLPHLCDGEGVLQTLPKHVADSLGLGEDIPVVLGASDGALHSVGLGAFRRGLLALNIGTSGAIRSLSKAPLIDKSKDMRFFCYYIGYGLRLPGGAINNAGMGLRWFRDEFGQSEIAAAKVMNEDPYNLLTKQAEKVDATAEKLLILPFFSGERFPVRDPYARGVMFGLTLRHGKAHLIRALMEGCLYTLKWIYDAMVENGVEGKAIRTGGGGARSALWRQIQADVFGLPVEKTLVEDASLLGAAMMGLVAIGAYKSLEEAGKNMIKVEDIKHPNMENHEKYGRICDLFKRLYYAVKELYVEHYTL
jgi:gluconokinase